MRQLLPVPRFARSAQIAALPAFLQITPAGWARSLAGPPARRGRSPTRNTRGHSTGTPARARGRQHASNALRPATRCVPTGSAQRSTPRRGQRRPTCAAPHAARPARAARTPSRTTAHLRRTRRPRRAARAASGGKPVPPRPQHTAQPAGPADARRQPCSRHRARCFHVASSSASRWRVIPAARLARSAAGRALSHSSVSCAVTANGR